MELLVRDVMPADAGAVVGILNPIIEARIHTAFDAPFSEDAEHDYIVGFPSRGVWKVVVRQANEQVVGFQVLEPFGPYTRAFDHVGTLGTYVDLYWRRQGIAKAIQRLIITRIPVILGSGIPLFGPVGRDITLRHVATREYPSFVQSEYVVA